MDLRTPETRAAAAAAAVTALAMIAYQVGARATRDAFFLSIYPLRLLPAMMVLTSLLAVALAYASTRALSRWGPDRLIPAGFGASAVLLLLEWAISFPAPRVAAVLLYLHYGSLGALLISGFWSLVNERFDPRTAKRQIGRITAAATTGGLLGGLIATQVASILPVTAMIPVLALSHLVSAAAVTRVRASAPSSVSSAAPAARGLDAGSERSGVRAIASLPYIRGLITLVLLVTISEGLIGLVFKGRAAFATGAGGELLRFFAVFYTGVSLLTVLVQAGMSRFVLEKLGPARTAAILPAGVAVAATGAIVVPGLPATVIAHGAESVLANSLYRAGYEVLFTPVPAREKRAIKALTDVGASRMGIIIAAGIAQAALVLPLPRQSPVLLTAAALLSLLAVVIAFRLHAGYIHTLARGLVSRAVQLDLIGVHDSITRSTVLETLGPRALSQDLARLQEARVATPRPGADPLTDASEAGMASEGQETEELRRIRDLHSRDAERVRRALQAGPIPPSLVPHVVPVLGWDDLAREAIAALRGAGPEAADHLIASATDPNVEFTIRRRIPLVLATYRDRRAVEGLLRGLGDQRFEVRYRCGRGLAHLLDLDPSLTVSREEAFAAVLREVEIGAGVWESQKVLDTMDDEAWSPVMDEVLRDRAHRRLEHVFTLLALVLPRQPLRIAFQALHTDDPLLRGTALEYLESSLPPEIRSSLWQHLEERRPPQPASPRPPEQVLQDLLHAGDSIVIKLEELKRREERS